MRLLVANLDCEAAFAEAAGVARYHPSLPVARRAAALGTLLGALGRRGDALWTPLPVDPARLSGELPVTLRSGPVRALSGIDAILAWGETREVAAWRAALPAAGPGSDHVDWPARLWSVIPDQDAAWRCNDRRFCVPLQEELGCRLPGAALLDSVDALRAHLVALGPGADQAWVLKAPFSASGRLRVRRRGPDLDRAIETRIERLFTRFGALCFEPWVERVLDIGCLGLVEGAEQWRIFPPHRLETDRAGVFRGIALEAEPGWLAPGDRQALARAADRAARALAGAGYRGPFGIDGFVYRLPRGERALQPICEINARLSFGFVARALARRHGAPALRLRVAAELPRPRPRVVPLLRPAADDHTAAWIEMGPGAG